MGTWMNDIEENYDFLKSSEAKQIFFLCLQCEAQTLARLFVRQERQKKPAQRVSGGVINVYP